MKRIWWLILLFGCTPSKEELSSTQNPQLQLNMSGVNSVLGLDTISKFSALSGSDFSMKANFAEAAVGFSITPAPTGSIRFDSATGEISGQVPANYNQTFTVTANFSDGRTLSTKVEISSAGEVNDFSLGPTQSCALVNNQLFCAGFNGAGKLGLNNKFHTISIPGKVSLTGVAKVKVHRNHSCALKLDGTVWCWGRNEYGQLGNALTVESAAPVRATEFGNSVVDLALGQFTTCALQGNKTVSCVGEGLEGRLGNEVGTNSTTAVSVSGLTQVEKLVGSDYHFCALKADHTAWCWGMGWYGQLGQGDGNYATVPVQMKNNTGSGYFNQITEIATGAYHTCLVNAGQAYCLGLNNYGQLGDGTTNVATLPRAIPGMTAVTKIVGGDYHSCAIASSALYCWGMNWVGQLGDGTTNTSYSPVAVVGLVGGVTDVWASGDVNPAISSTTCARDSENVKCWGANQYGQISGLKKTFVETNTITLPGAATAISEQGSTLCALIAGAVYCQGLSDYGQLGISSFRKSVMTKIGGVSSVVKVVAARYEVCAIKSDNTLYCWGYGGSGNFGNGSTNSSYTPILSNVTNVMDVAIGRHHACALKGDNTVWCFGGNYNGQLGNGNTTDQSNPAQVLSSAKKIAVGDAISCAVKNNNSVWCWGTGAYGALGNNQTSNSNIPVQVAGLPGGAVDNLDVSAFGGCVTVAGKLYCWGRDAKFWNGGSGDALTAVSVKADQNFSTIVLKKYSWGGCAKNSKDDYVCFGNNYSKNFEDVKLETLNTPQVTKLVPESAQALVIGDSASCYLSNTGAVKCWGFDLFGQATNGSTGYLLDKTIPGPFDVR